MSRYKHRFFRSGKQSFPTTDRSNFPFNALISRYVLNLLPHSPFHDEFFHLLFSFTGIAPAAEVITEVFDRVLTKEDVKNIETSEDVSDLIRQLLPLLEKHATMRTDKMLRVRLAEILQDDLPAMPAMSSGYGRRKLRLMQLLDLSLLDIRVIECFACYQAGGQFEDYCDQYTASDWTSLIATALDLPKKEVRSRIIKGGSLASKGLVEIRKSSFESSDEVFEYLCGLSDDFLCGDEYSMVKESSFPLNSFPVEEKARGILLESLSSPAPCHLFFYGRPGTGKTELAKALASEAGRKAFLVKYGSDGDERDRRGAITATMGIAPTDSVVIIDEADRILNTATFFERKQVDKGWINNFMDECQHKIIWIANESRCIESSVLRRFSYSLEFKKFTAAQRESAWKMQLKSHALKKVIRPAMVSRLAHDYETDAGGIASALKAATNIFDGQHPEADEVEQTLGRLLRHHEKLSGVERKKKKLNQLSPNYDVDALHTDLSPSDLISSLKARQRNIENGQRPFSANIMFWGLPGTGKTEFAKYIAQELGKELLIKRMSDLQSMYVGQTEKQIAEAFEEAEREGAVLFLDEADSLILDRKTASRSWESSQTNEVLSQMENFSGVCICCTNLLDQLDEAALRRFTWKMKFLPLTDEGKEKLFRKYFQPKGRLSSEVRKLLNGIRDLTPGDFKTVHQRQQYSSGAASPRDIVNALKAEASYNRSRSSTIGFAA